MVPCNFEEPLNGKPLVKFKYYFLYVKVWNISLYVKDRYGIICVSHGAHSCSVCCGKWAKG